MKTLEDGDSETDDDTPVGYVKLEKPIEAHGGDITELTLREPTGKDIRQLGLPYCAEVVEGERTKVHFETVPVSKYISRLARIPLHSVDDLDPADWQTCMSKVMGFFGQDPEDAEASSRDTSIA